VRLVSVIDGLGFGGAERSLAELLPGLVEAGIDPTVVCLRRRDGGVERDVIGQGFQVRFLPPGRVERIKALREILREGPADLLHTSLVESSLVGRIAAMKTGVPVLTSLVNQAYTAERRSDPHVHRWAVSGVRAVDRVTARHMTSHFHAITHAVKRWAVESLRISAERITVVERGREPRRLGEPGPERRAAARDQLGVARDAEVIVAVGRQEFQKGHRFLVEAMPSVVRSRPAAVLLLAGREGAETAHLRGLVARLGLQQTVHFLGFRSDLPEVLAASDVFAFPSLWEGLGGAVIEAMALGLPIVATDLEPVREVVEDDRCALLVPTRAPDELAEAIARLLGDPGLGAALGVQGRDIFQERFTLQRSTERMVALYRRVAQGSTPRAATDGIEVA
jgi:glycosyltransferase involved in cell wall biosynthesis